MSPRLLASIVHTQLEAALWWQRAFEETDLWSKMYLQLEATVRYEHVRKLLGYKDER